MKIQKKKYCPTPLIIIIQLIPTWGGGVKKSESHDGEWETDYSSEDKNTLEYKNFDTDDDCSSATIKSEKCKKVKFRK